MVAPLRLRWLLVMLLATVPASAEYKLFLRQTAGLWQNAENGGIARAARRRDPGYEKPTPGVFYRSYPGVV